MKTTKSLMYALALGAISLGSTSCKKDEKQPKNPQTVFYGQEKDLGDGTVKTVVELDKNGKPEMLGVIFSETALNGLPMQMAMLDLPFPAEAKETPFDHLGFDWQPHGHEPNGVYTIPHFDIHFYMMSMADRMKIGVNDSLSEKLPAAKYMPASFIALPGSVPMMGKHWIDPASPELNGALFTQTFLMGSYNEKVTFYEPMITVDYFKLKKTEVINIPSPADYQQKGKYYPTEYHISYDAQKQEYTVSLQGFEKR